MDGNQPEVSAVVPVDEDVDSKPAIDVQQLSGAAADASPRSKWRLPRVDWQELRSKAPVWLRGQVERDVWWSIAHVLVLMGLLVMLRPVFMEMMPEEVYQADSVFGAMFDRDLTAIAEASREQMPIVPDILFLLPPTVILLLARRGLRWTEWEHGRALRLLIVLPLAMFAYSGSTFDYNMYLDEGHAIDRLLLVAAAIASWYTPLAVPIATRFAMVMLKEAYVPIRLDDFEFRAPAEFMCIASIFIWASAVSHSFKIKHFLLVFISSWAGYYYIAGIAKWNIGPEYSWLLENKLTNVAVAGYVRGWMSFLDHDAYMRFIDFVAHFDLAMAVFTLVIEMGAIIGLFIHPRLSKWWFIGLAILNLGIFATTGIFFWKWIFPNFVFAWWVMGPGRPLVDQLYRQKLVLLVGIFSVWWSTQHYRVLYWTTRVSWYDTRLEQNYELWGIGESGQRYLIDPATITPMDMHWTQGSFCYTTNDHSLTGIFATSGNYGIMKKLENYEQPEQALRLFKGAKRCGNKRRKAFDDFMIRYFGNINRYGRKHQWLSWIGRPAHIWVFPKGSFYEGLDRYEEQEPLTRIEVTRQVIYRHGGKLHNLDQELVHTVDIPADGKPPRKPKDRKK